MKVFYHQEWKPDSPTLFSVLKKNQDGTVDIGPEGGPAVVTNCKITSEPKFGSCTEVKEESKGADSENTNSPAPVPPSEPLTPPAPTGGKKGK